MSSNNLQTVEDALHKKKSELEELETEIESIHNQAEGHKEAVLKYNSLKKTESDLKKEKAKKQRDLTIVANFFNSVDEHFLDNIFPLFGSQNKEESVSDQPAGGGSVVSS